MRAAIYARVSTEAQEEGSSLDSQVEECMRAAKDLGYEVPASFIFREVYSRAELWNRPLLSQMREELVTQRRVDAVFSLATDRLSGDPVHLLILLEEADRHGVRILFVTEPYDDSEEGKLIQYVRGYAAKVEREKIKERTLRGKFAKVKSGKLLGSGRNLYGYQMKDGVREVAEPQAATVKLIFDWASQGVPIRKIARRLTQSGTPSPTGKTHWAKSTVSRILHEPAYSGHAYAWRWKREGKLLIERDRDEWVKLPDSCSPPIVSEALWHSVQERLSRNKLLATRNSTNPERFLLAGYVRCGNCGFPMWTDSRQRKGSRTTCYRCRGAVAHQQSTCEPGSRPWIAAKSLDCWVWNHVSKVLSDPKVVKREVERLPNQPIDDSANHALDKAIAKNRSRQQGLIAAIGELGEEDGEGTRRIRNRLLDALRETDNEQLRLKGERQRLQDQILQQQVASERLSEVADWCEQVHARLGSFKYEEKRLALEAVGAEVFVYPTQKPVRAELFLHIPGRTSPIAVSTTC